MKGVINVALPLAVVPPLVQVRNALISEFPYAVEVIDFVLADPVGRTTIRFRPLLLVGKPGAGKTVFVRKLSRALGLPSIWRTDCSRADGAVFGGTDRRWHTAEPCHPLLAVAQAKVGNAFVLLDELEKAGTRSRRLSRSTPTNLGGRKLRLKTLSANLKPSRPLSLNSPSCYNDNESMQGIWPACNFLSSKMQWSGWAGNRSDLICCLS